MGRDMTYTRLPGVQRLASPITSAADPPYPCPRVTVPFPFPSLSSLLPLPKSHLFIPFQKTHFPHLFCFSENTLQNPYVLSKAPHVQFWRGLSPPVPVEYFLSQYVRKSTHIGSGTSTPINGSTQRVPEE